MSFEVLQQAETPEEKAVENMNRYITNAYTETISEQALEYFDSEDYQTKEQMQEIHENYISEIECADSQDEENYIWDNGYARGYEVAMQDILLYKKHKK